MKLPDELDTGGKWELVFLSLIHIFLNFGGKVSPEDYMRLQKYALGRFLFSLSGMRIVEPAET